MKRNIASIIKETGTKWNVHRTIGQINSPIHSFSTTLNLGGKMEQKERQIARLADVRSCAQNFHRATLLEGPRAISAR